MVTGVSEQAQDLSALFKGPVRWGWEFVAPVPARTSPERNTPPGARTPRLIPRRQAAELTQIAIVSSAAAIGIIWFDSFNGLFRGGATGVMGDLMVLAHFVAAGVFVWVARAWMHSRTGHLASNVANNVWNWVIPFAGAVVTLLAPYIVLPLVAVAAWFLFLRRSGLVPDPKDVAKAQAEYKEAVAAWQQRVVQFETAEQRRYATLDIWFPVQPSVTAQTICAFGGTEISWAAALTTLGASLLGAGSRLLVLDLSRRRSSQVLENVASLYGFAVARSLLPSDSRVSGLLANFTWNDLSTVLVEILYATESDVHASRQGRQDDRAIIREVANCLDPSGPVSFARLRKALIVVMGGPTPTAAGDVTEAEFDRLARLYNQVQREHGGVLERVTRIERVLRDFDAFSSDSATERHSLLLPRSNGSTSAIQLQVLDIDKRLDDLDHDRMVDLVFQLLMRRLRSQPITADVLIVLGADRIQRAVLESMREHAARNGLRVLFFFEHLREDAIQVIGSGGAAAAFFALGNHLEAKEASDFIGAGYKWVESQRTRSEGESLTRTWGTEGSESSGVSETDELFSHRSLSQTRTMGLSYSAAFGKTRDYSVGEQRVREMIVEPEVIQGLPVTGMIWIEVLDNGRRVAANVDCHPQITFAPRRSSQPRSLPPHVGPPPGTPSGAAH